MNTRVAVPSMSPGGLDAQRSGHFGQCEVFTLVELEDGKVRNVSVVGNLPHEHGGCLAPVGLLQEAGADALIVGGIGMRPLMGFRHAGIHVYFAADDGTVADAVGDLTQGKLPLIGDEQVCGGCSNH